MEPQGSSPCSQKPATGPYPEPGESNSLHRSLSPFFHCLGRAKESVQVRSTLEHFVTNYFFYGEGLLAPRPTPSWRTTPRRLPAIAYSIYSHLPSVSRGLPSIRNPRTRHAVVTKDPPNMDFLPLTSKYSPHILFSDTIKLRF
jgi:hypothetical protein